MFFKFRFHYISEHDVNNVHPFLQIFMNKSKDTKIQKGGLRDNGRKFRPTNQNYPKSIGTTDTAFVRLMGSIRTPKENVVFCFFYVVAPKLHAYKIKREHLGKINPHPQLFI